MICNLYTVLYVALRWAVAIMNVVGPLVLL